MRNNFVICSPIKVELTKDENKAAEQRITEFCSSMNAKGQSSEYLKEQRNANKPETDIHVGKKAEEFVAKAFGIDPIEIDYEIRKDRSKGWRPDFFDNWHVKGCTKYIVDLIEKHRKVPDKSWTFQLSNVKSSGGTDPLFYKQFDKTQYVFHVYMDYPTDAIGYIEVICPWHYIKGDKNHLLENPIHEYLSKVKKCTYLSTMNTYFMSHPDRVSSKLCPYTELT